MQPDNCWTRAAPTRTTQQAGQHHDQQRPESSGQKHHALGVDGKSLTEWLGCLPRNTIEDEKNKREKERDDLSVEEDPLKK
jgi:hypothetical protein